ncbi:MAG: 30S ribosomal protein S2, partial [Bacteroidetes bacterium]|nr:30S ribosomal protein S2 [Bacteroidota bacterium]
LNDTTLTSITKKERLTLAREHAKMAKHFGGIEQLNRLPSAVFIVDIHHEHLALAESKKLNVKTFGMVDTNSDPTLVDYPVPSNDDASKSIAFVTNYLANAIREGLEERKAMKGDEKEGANASEA